MLWAKEVCRHVYNRLLETYNAGEHDRFTLQNLLPIWKQTNEDMVSVYAKTLQYEVVHLFANLASLKELKKRGRKVGNLRFKGERWFKTFTYNQLGFKLLPKNNKSPGSGVVHSFRS